MMQILEYEVYFIINQGHKSLRCLDTVFKKLSYSLLNTLNFRTVKFK